MKHLIEVRRQRPKWVSTSTVNEANWRNRRDYKSKDNGRWHKNRKEGARTRPINSTGHWDATPGQGPPSVIVPNQACASHRKLAENYEPEIWGHEFFTTRATAKQTLFWNEWRWAIMLFALEDAQEECQQMDVESCVFDRWWTPEKVWNSNKNKPNGTFEETFCETYE